MDILGPLLSGMYERDANAQEVIRGMAYIRGCMERDCSVELEDWDRRKRHEGLIERRRINPTEGVRSK